MPRLLAALLFAITLSVSAAAPLPVRAHDGLALSDGIAAPSLPPGAPPADEPLPDLPDLPDPVPPPPDTPTVPDDGTLPDDPSTPDLPDTPEIPELPDDFPPVIDPDDPPIVDPPDPPPPPDIPQPFIPAPPDDDNSSALPSIAVNLTWRAPAGSTQVHLQVVPYNNDGPGLDLIIGDPVTVSTGSYSIGAPRLGEGNYLLLPGMTYGWRIRFSSKLTFASTADPSWSPWVNGKAFRTPNPSSAAIRPVGPLNGASQISATGTALQWSHPDLSLFYFEIQVSGDSRFDTDPSSATSFVWWNLVHAGLTSPPGQWRMPNLLPATTYYWRVRPRVQGDGAPVSWSDAWKFTTAGNGVAAPIPTDSVAGMEQEMLYLTNNERLAAGLVPLVMDVALADVARAYSSTMIQRNYFAHNTPEGLTPFDRMRAAGITFGYAGENLARASTVPKAHTALMNSPAHKANILGEHYRKVGIGIVPYSGGLMITQNYTD